MSALFCRLMSSLTPKKEFFSRTGWKIYFLIWFKGDFDIFNSC